MTRLEGKVALITGSAKGQGASHARLFVDEGARVVVSDVLDDRGRELASELGESAVYLPLDVRSEEAWARGVRATLVEFGQLDILVNNAGVSAYGPLSDVALDDYLDVIMVNQIGCFLGMRTAAPAMRPGGSIINVSSVCGLGGGVNAIAYVASKFAIRAMTKTAALELGPSLRVNSVHPGAILTDMCKEALGASARNPFDRIPLGRIGRAEEVSEMICFLGSDEAGYVTGAEFTIDGGWFAGPTLE